MKLAIVTTHPIQYNAPWFELLANQGTIDVMVFYTWEQSQHLAKHDPDFGKVIEWDLPLLEGYNFKFVKNVSKNQGSSHFKGIDNPSLVSEILNWNADAVLVFGWAFKSHLACLRFFKGKIPVLFRGDSTLIDEKGGLKQLLRRLFLTYVYRHVDYALYVGTNNKNYFLAHGLTDKQLIFTPHAIDNSRFTKDSTTVTQQSYIWKKELGIEEDDFVILFAGKFIEKKNPFFILELAKRLSGNNVKFILVGNGKLEEDLKQQSSDDRIIFMDFQNQAKMPLVYNLCDVFVLPSNGPGETWGLAINEAMACNRFVVTTTKVGCAIDLVMNEKNGLVIEPGDVDRTVAYIEKLIEGKIDSSEKTVTNTRLLNIYSYNNLITSIINTLEQVKKVD